MSRNQMTADIARRAQAAYGDDVDTIIREMFSEGYSLRVIASVLETSQSYICKQARRLGLHRPPIKRSEFPSKMPGLSRDVCADRIGGRLTYQEIGAKYDIGNGTITEILRRYAPNFVGDKYARVQVRPPNVSAEERQRRAERIRTHAAGGRFPALGGRYGC